MKKLFTAIFIFIAYHASATDWNEWTFQPKQAFRNSFGFSTEYYFASNAITNRFVSDFLRNSFIDNAKKDNISTKLTPLNKLGIESNTDIKYTHRNDTVFGLPKSFFSVSLTNRYHINSRFRKDVFELYFRGNKEYAGKKADLNDFIYNQVFYQQLIHLIVCIVLQYCYGLNTD